MLKQMFNPVPQQGLYHGTSWAMSAGANPRSMHQSWAGYEFWLQPQHVPSTDEPEIIFEP